MQGHYNGFGILFVSFDPLRAYCASDLFFNVFSGFVSDDASANMEALENHWNFG